MVFITPLLEKWTKKQSSNFFALIFRQLLMRKSCLKVLLSLLFMCSFHSAFAEGISVQRAEAIVTSDGRLAVSSRFQTELPGTLISALQRGVPLDFVLEYRLEKPRMTSYRSRLMQLLGSDGSISYRLSYQALTTRYRVSVGTYHSEYSSLSSALRSLGAVSNWQVLGYGTLQDVKAKDVRASVRLSLNTDKLPKPFQINAITSSSWNLNSGWKRLNIGE